MDKFGKLLKDAREALGYTGEQMGDLVYGQPNGAYYRSIENGDKKTLPHRATLRRISKILGLDYDLLVRLAIQRKVEYLMIYFSEERENESPRKRRKLPAKEDPTRNRDRGEG